MKLSIFQTPARRARVGWAASVVAVACAWGVSTVAWANAAQQASAAAPAPSAPATAIAVSPDPLAWHHLHTRLETQATTAQALQAANEKLLSRLDVQEQRLVETQRKSVDWWLTAIGVGLTLVGLFVAIGGFLIPVYWLRSERSRLKETQAEFESMKQEAGQALSKLQTHEKEGAQSAAALKQAKEDASNIQPGEPPRNAEQVSVVQRLKQASDLTSQLLAAAITASQVQNPTNEQAEHAYGLWKALTVLDATDRNAQFNAGYWAQQIYKQADVASRQHWLATLQKHYSVLPTSHKAVNNWGNALDDEATEVAKRDLPEARKRWAQAGEKYAQALSLKPDMHEAVNNWGFTLNAEATKVAKSDLLEARKLWAQSYEKYAQALQLKPDMPEAANNWGIALNAEATKVAKSDLLEARRLWAQSYEKYAQALQLKPDMPEAAHNWGNTLNAEANAVVKSDLSEARNLWAQAYEKYTQALSLKPDMHETAHNWAVAYAHQGIALVKAEQTQNADKFFDKAHALILQHLNKYPEAAAQSAYNLACIYGLQGNASEAVAQLELARQNNLLPPGWREDTDLNPIRHSQEYRDWVAQHFPSPPDEKEK